jgi:DNA mismatch repair protein MutL
MPHSEPNSPPPRRARIALLPERVKNQIAAGEVIERPSSVVKELLENALDAGARAIRIDLEEGGVRLVRIVDDGCGMSRGDLELAFVSHATSKLFDVADLEHIASLGFRGEALASMGAVARCTILSRETGAETGWKIECDGGHLADPREAGGPVGTTIEVRDLFFNVPARRRFLKQTATELGRILDIVQRLALAHEGVGFSATHDGRRLYDVDASMDLRARIRRTFGAELEAALQPVLARDGDVSLRGFVAPPRFARGDTARQMWFVNGRAMKDKVLLRALKDSYRGFLFDNRQPVAFLMLSMDPARVDVNVHPAKSEVRFRDERRLFGFLVNAIRDAVRKTDMATPGARLVETAQRREDRENQLPFTNASFGERAQREPYAVFEIPAVRADAVLHPDAIPRGDARVSRDVAAALRGDALAPRGDATSLRADAAGTADSPSPHAGSAAPSVPSASRAFSHGPFLQVGLTYIVRPLDDGFEIVDQHALHERIQFEALSAELARGAIEMQRFLVPELIDLSRAEVETLSAHFETLSKIGIDLSAFGETTIAVNGMPARLARPRPVAIVRDALAIIENAREIEAGRLLEDVLHSAACRSSVMAGDRLAEDEIRALFERGSHLLSDQTCVHGRPTRVRFTLSDLEKAFNRR